MSIFGKLFGKKQPAKIKKAVASPSVTKKVALKKASVKKATPVKKSVSSKKK
jgi:hypothetical protein